MTWPRVPLSRLGRIVGGGTPSKQNPAFWQGDIPWVSPKDMKDRDLWNTEDHISSAAVEGSATQVVPTGSVLLVVRSGILVRHLPLAIARVPVALNQDMKAILPGGPLSPEFLTYALQNCISYVLTECVKRGATVHSVDMAKLGQMRVVVPPPLEQRRIVELLDQAEALLRKRADADEKAARILPALYRRLFLDVEADWPTEPLGTHLRKTKGALQSGPFGTHLHNSDFIDDGPVRVVGIDNVLDGEFAIGRNRRISFEKYGELKKYTLEPGDVLMTIMGTVGRTCVFPRLDEPAICTKHVYRIQLDGRLAPDYVCASIRFSPAVRGQLGASTTGQIVAGITSEDIRRLHLKVPPRGLQDQFTEVTRALAALQSHWRHTGRELDRLFADMLRRAFEGALTASWREAHMQALLKEMEEQAQYLAASGATA